MPANLTPQYLRQRKNTARHNPRPAPLTCLETMYRVIPKHKRGRTSCADLKYRMAEARVEITAEKARPKPPRATRFRQRRASVLLGGPNSGKSRLLASLTNAKLKSPPSVHHTNRCRA